MLSNPQERDNNASTAIVERHTAHRCQCPELGWPCPACGRGRSRLTAVHDALVRRYQQGERLRILAQDYGVTPRAINYYLHTRGLWQSRGGSNQYTRRTPRA